MDRPKQTFPSVDAMFDCLRGRLDDSDDIEIRVPEGEACEVRCGVNRFLLNREQLAALLNDKSLRGSEPTVSVTEVPTATESQIEHAATERLAKQRLATEKDWPLQQAFYLRVRDRLNSGESLPFPEDPVELTSMIYALIDHDDFYGGNWAAAMERIAFVELTDAAPVVQSSPKRTKSATQDYVATPRKPYPPRNPRDVMRRRNRLVMDADGRRFVKIETHKHESPDRLELQIDVLKENQRRWPGATEMPPNAEHFRRGAAAQLALQGVTKLVVKVPEVEIWSKGHLQIVIEALNDSVMSWRKFVQDGNSSREARRESRETIAE